MHEWNHHRTTAKEGKSTILLVRSCCTGVISGRNQSLPQGSGWQLVRVHTVDGRFFFGKKGEGELDE